MDYEDIYIIGRIITGVILFIGIWIYAFAKWGFLIGLAIGWLPAIIGAFLLSFLWPLFALAIIAIILILLYNYRTL